MAEYFTLIHEYVYSVSNVKYYVLYSNEVRAGTLIPVYTVILLCASCTCYQKKSFEISVL